MNSCKGDRDKLRPQSGVEVSLIRFRFKKRARITASMLASASFLMLAVWGWDLPVETVIQFFVICLGFLLAIVITAALAGGMFRMLSHFREKRRSEAAEKSLEQE